MRPFVVFAMSFDWNSIILQGERKLALCPQPHDDHLSCLHDLGIKYLSKFEHLAQFPDLDRGIELFEETLVLRPPGHHERYWSLHNLSCAFRMRFNHSGQLSDLDRAIELAEEGIHLSSPSQTSRSICLTGLGDALIKRFLLSRQLHDLNRAIELLEEALPLQPPSHLWRSLLDLASALGYRFGQSKQLLDLDRLIDILGEAVILPPLDQTRHISSLSLLVRSLHTRFKRSEQLHDINRAIELNEQLLALLPTGHPDRLESLLVLAQALRDRFNRSEQLLDLDRMIEVLDEAVTLQPSGQTGHVTSLLDLAQALRDRFNRSEQLLDLDRMIEVLDEAVTLQPPGQTGHVTSLVNLARCLCTRFEQSGQLRDSDRVIELHEKLLALHPTDHPDHIEYLINLASHLRWRFYRSVHLPDLDRGIMLGEEALRLCSRDQPLHIQCLSTVVESLFMRFERMKSVMDLLLAEKHSDESLSLCPLGHPERFRALANVAAVRRTTFEHAEPLQNMLREIDHLSPDSNLNVSRERLLDTSIELYEEALSLCPQHHPHRSRMLANLAATLIHRFGLSRQSVDLDNIIRLQEEALELHSSGDSQHFIHLSNLAGYYRMRFIQSRQRADLDKAISYSREVLECCPGVFRAIAHVNLAEMHRSPDPPELDHARAEFSRGAQFESSMPHERFRAALCWIDLCTESEGTHHEAIAAYEVAMDLLPQFFWLELHPEVRLKTLQRAPSLACDAAAWALRSGNVSRAVEFLEQGRSIYWMASLGAQNSFDGLPDDLSIKLKTLSDQLRAEPDWPGAPELYNTVTYDKRRIQEDWMDAIGEVRKLAGFENFLRAKSFSQSMKVAGNGPVVMLVGSVHGCSALIFKQGCEVPQHILFEIGFDDITRLSGRLTCALAYLGISRDSNSSGSAAPSQSIEPRHGEYEMRRILTDLWEFIVEPVIDNLGVEESENPQRLWWCPTGPFSFLPLHAAGDGRRAIDQFFISSYIPTLGALLVAQSSATTVAHPKVVVVVQPNATGLQPLQHSIEESQRIAEIVPSQFMINTDFTQRTGTQAYEHMTIQNVLDWLSEASIVHFACHGKQDPQEPLKSALLLQDGELTIRMVQSIRRSPASLAFLSACGTAQGHQSQPDEVIHMAAAMLYTGFQGVVATMWPMADLDGPVIAGAFYKELFESIPLDTSHAAHALHKAVRQLRVQGVPPHRWVPFIHFGI